MKNDDQPAIPWFDNGGQFKTAPEPAFQELLYSTCAPIPPGHSAENWYVEVLNRILTAMHGGERQRLGRATVAYNAETKDRLAAAPVTIWRAPRPPTSRWTHMAARDTIRKIDGAEETLGAEEELNDDMQRVADWGEGSSSQEAIGSFEE